jgi:hypothetical protein
MLPRAKTLQGKLIQLQQIGQMFSWKEMANGNVLRLEAALPLKFIKYKVSLLIKLPLI